MSALTRSQLGVPGRFARRMAPARLASWLLLLASGACYLLPTRRASRCRLPTAAASDDPPRIAAPSGHTLSGIDIRAAGIIPYTLLKGHGLKFFMQDMTNGTRAGQLCDFGGRRELEDSDLFDTAARELTEETAGAFGSADELARRLRTEHTIRILNPTGKYVTFFLKVRAPAR